MAIGYSARLPLRFDFIDGPYALNKDLPSVVKQNIKMLIFTAPGERIMDANFGVGIRSYLFENMSEITFDSVRERTLDQMKIYLPFVNVISLDIFSTEESPNTMFFKMTYSFPSSNEEILKLEIR